MAKRMAVQGRDAFDHRASTRLIHAPGAISALPELLSGLTSSADPQSTDESVRSVFLVTDPGLVEAGHAGRVKALIEDAGVEVRVFAEVRENPTTEDVEACLARVQDGPVDVFIGLGGGSSMDTARACNFLLTNGGRMEDYQGYGKASKPMKALVAIPTTAGTGSECQSFALIAKADDHSKMACGDPKAAARVALLDPELTLTQPRAVTANTGLDALVHALETAVTKAGNSLSRMYACESFRLLSGAFERVLSMPEDLEARSKMQLGAAFAGLAIENSMLGAAHSAANPLTAEFDLVHGRAVALMLPWVMRFNMGQAEALGLYAQLARRAELASSKEADADAAAALLQRVEELIQAAGLDLCIKPYLSPPSAEAGFVSFDEACVAELARRAAGQWTAQFNPRPITAEDFEAIYRCAYDGRA